MLRVQFLKEMGPADRSNLKGGMRAWCLLREALLSPATRKPLIRPINCMLSIAT